MPAINSIISGCKKPFLKDFLNSLVQFIRFRNLPAEKRNIVFYSESGQDWHHLEPLVRNLSKDLSRTVCYISSDSKDPGLHQDNSRILSFYIREGLLQILLFQFLKAEVLVLTMEDLQVFQLKRSIYPVHYIFVFHAMGSTHMVNLDRSYDHYDTLFCTGEHQKVEIRRREELKGLPKKELFNYGYPRLDTLTKQKISRDNKEKHETPVILIAPTWGDNSILNVCGLRLVQVLLEARFNTILRPHYQTIKLTPHIVTSIVEKFESNPLFSCVTKMGDMDSLFESDLLVCDWSSTSIEYALGLEKPVLYIDVPRRVRNPDYHSLGIEPLEVTIREKIGSVLDLGSLEKAPEMILKLLQEPKKFAAKIAELRDKLVFNPGKSAEIGSAEIASIADKIAGERSKGVKRA